MAINERAPVVARGEIEIEAPAGVVWELMSGIDQWPTWNPEIRSARLEGTLAAGSTFKWRAGPGEITSTLREVRPPEWIEWTGTTFGIRAVHVWRVRAAGPSTIAATEESWEGLPVRLLRGQSQRRLDAAISSGLQLLKSEAERRAKEGI